MRTRTRAMLAAFAGGTRGGAGHIANLGHGITPDMPVAHVAAFVETVQGWTADERTA